MRRHDKSPHTPSEINCNCNSNNNNKKKNSSSPSTVSLQQKNRRSSLARSLARCSFRRIIPAALVLLVVLLAVGNLLWSCVLVSPHNDNSLKSSSSSSIHYRGRVYTCGYTIPLARHWFPDYEFVEEEWKPNENHNKNHHKDDILVVGMWGQACAADETKFFGGKILYVNGEPNGDPVANAWHHNQQHHQHHQQEDEFSREIYQIGPYPKRQSKQMSNNINNITAFEEYHQKHSLQVYHAAMEFMGHVYLSQENAMASDDENDPFDPWKQLVEGSTPHVTEEERRRPRIPAIVYVSTNCVPFRQDAAELLARVFRPNAVPGVESTPTNHHNHNHNHKMKQQHQHVLDPSKHLRNSATPNNIAARTTRTSVLSTNLRNPRFDDSRSLQESDTNFHELSRRDENTNANNSNDSDEISNSQDSFPPSSSFVHFGGNCPVPGGIPIPMEVAAANDRSEFHSNYKTIYRRYKYCLVLENTYQKGYVTEKILQALLGGCLAIYYGSKDDVYQLVREDAFVYWDIDNPEPALQEIATLEANHTEYLRRTDRSLPILKGGSSSNNRNTKNNPLGSTQTTVDDYFSLLPTVGSGKLVREIHQMMGLALPASLNRES